MIVEEVKRGSCSDSTADSSSLFTFMNDYPESGCYKLEGFRPFLRIKKDVIMAITATDLTQ